MDKFQCWSLCCNLRCDLRYNLRCDLRYNLRRNLSGSSLARSLQDHIMILQVMAVLPRSAETAIKLSRNGSSLAGIHRHNKKADAFYLQEGRISPLILCFSLSNKYIRLTVKLYKMTA